MLSTRAPQGARFTKWTIMRRRETGFTLIEILIVVAIVGVIAAIAIPNLLTAMQRARQKRTMADIRSIALAWESRATDNSTFAAAGFSLCCTVSVSFPHMTTLLYPTYINPMPHHDGWRHPFEFALSTDGTQYLIRSYGRHGVRDSNPVGGATSYLDCDIIYSGGQFVQYPEGIQVQ